MKISKEKIAAYILAGGAAKRFDGQLKGLVELNGKPLLSYVISAIEEQVSSIVINSHAKDYQVFGLPIITDSVSNDDVNKTTAHETTGHKGTVHKATSHKPTGHKGPLHGLYACLQHLHQQEHQEESSQQVEWLFLVACDMPALTPSCVTGLVEAIQAEKNKGRNYQAASFSYDGFLQPTVSLWHISVLDQLKHAVEEKQWSGLKVFFESLGEHALKVDYPADSHQQNPFININSALELKQFEQSLSL
jgi:molybdopterin-guanine dinucleotide biosynthesis protein A